MKKKFILSGLFALLLTGCVHLPSQNDTNQARKTLKTIGIKLGNYYAANKKYPGNEEQEKDFSTIGMKDPSSKEWEYRFFCYEDTHNCLIDAMHQIKNLNPGKRFLTLSLEVKEDIPADSIYVLFHDTIPTGHEGNIYFSSSQSYAVDTKFCQKINGQLDKNQNCFLK